MLIILTIINTLCIAVIGTVVFFNRKYILNKDKATKGLSDLVALEEQEKDTVDKINQRFAKSFREEFDFMSDF